MENKSSSGFFDMILDSFHFLWKNIVTYIWMSIILAIPVIVVGAVLGFFIFAPTAFGQEAIELPPFDTANTAEAEADFDLSDMEGFENVEGMDELENALKNMNFDAANPTSYEGGFDITGFPFALMGLTFLLFVLYQIYAALALLRLTALLHKGEKPAVKSILKWAWERFGGYLMLSLRILGYTYIWLVIVVGLGYAVIAALMSTGAFGFMANYMGIVNITLGALGLFGLVMSIMRGPRAVFAQYVFADESTTSKEALVQSIKVSEGKWWKIVLYVLGSALLIGIGAELISSILEAIHMYLSLGFDFIMQFVLGYFFLIFYLRLYKSMKS